MSQMTRQDVTVARLGQGTYVIELLQSPDDNGVALYYQNRAYSQLTDIHHIDFKNKDSFLVFIKDLKSVDADHIYHADNYMISGQKGMFGVLYLWVYDADRSGYFWVTSKNIKKFEDAALKLK